MREGSMPKGQKGQKILIRSEKVLPLLPLQAAGSFAVDPWRRRGIVTGMCRNPDSCSDVECPTSDAAIPAAHPSESPSGEPLGRVPRESPSEEPSGRTPRERTDT